MDATVYIAIDGDDVGNLLREKIISNDLKGSAELSSAIHSFIDSIVSILEQENCTTIFAGGDSILSLSPTKVVDNLLDKLPQGPCTISIGIGETPEYAYLALQLAKARGKNQQVILENVISETTRHRLK